jgi:hypothetical protein
MAWRGAGKIVFVFVLLVPEVLSVLFAGKPVEITL